MLIAGITIWRALLAWRVDNERVKFLLLFETMFDCVPRRLPAPCGSYSRSYKHCAMRNTRCRAKVRGVACSIVVVELTLCVCVQGRTCCLSRVHCLAVTFVRRRQDYGYTGDVGCLHLGRNPLASCSSFTGSCKTACVWLCSCVHDKWLLLLLCVDLRSIVVVMSTLRVC